MCSLSARMFMEIYMDNTNEKKHSHGCLITLIVLLILGACIFGVVKYIQYQDSNQPVDGYGTTQGNTDGNNKLLSRSANNNDVTISDELDLASLGGKYTVMPKTDIKNLEITVNFLDKNKKLLKSHVESLGNVKEGVQASFSISLFDMGLSVAWNTEYQTVVVTGGTVSYFG